MKTRRLSVHGWILVALASGSVAWLAPRSKTLASTLSTEASFEDLLVALLGLVALVASAWFLTVAAALLAGSPHAWLRIMCPTFLGALLITAQQGAHAAEVSLDGLRLPDRPVSALRIDTPPPRAIPSSETVVVR
ncbi:MAG: hypothetical protein JWP10_362, partial [Nocardioidaceae bacterium]|nr:hypothetical protein [Nocardioidaceae bacterium]